MAINDPQNNPLSTVVEMEQISDLSYSSSEVEASFVIPLVLKRRVDLLLSIPVHKATGDDGISAKILRMAAPTTADPLSKLINHCIDT